MSLVLACLLFTNQIHSVIFCVGSGLQASARNFGDLVIGRAIGGLGVGALR